MPRPPHIAQLDGWRGLAITALLIGHFTQISVLNFGRLGVELFFVLSGRLMAQLLFNYREPLDVFYQRRLSRVVPGTLALVALVTLAFLALGRSPQYGLLASALLFFTNYYTISHLPTMPLDHLWSLAIEEHAYVVLSAVALLQRAYGLAPARALTCLIGACAINMLIQGLLRDWDYYELFWRSDIRAASIFWGALFSLRSEVVAPSGVARPSALLAMSAFAAGVGLQAEPVFDAVKYTLGTCLLAFSVNHLEALPKRIQRLLAARTLIQLGTWSFSLYLWQQPFHGWGPKGLVPTAICGLASFYCIENPARQALNRWYATRRAKRVGA
jgi:peptidoglycan/LPS O-acetylase OafA/YrhL